MTETEAARIFRRLEHRIGLRGTLSLRWALFVPVSLFSGFVIFALSVLGARGTGQYFGEEIQYGAVLLGGLVAGVVSVRAGTITAPSNLRLAACLSGAACVAFAALFIVWAVASHDSAIMLSSILCGGAFCFGAIVTSVIFALELHKQHT